MSNKEHLPYFKSKVDLKERYLGNFLFRKTRPFLRKNLPEHYLVNRQHGLTVKYLKKQSAKYSYFLKLDIKKFFPAVDHSILIHKIPEILEELTGRPVSRRAKVHLKKDLPLLLRKNPAPGKGLPLGNYLAYVLAGMYLLPLDLELNSRYKSQYD